MPEILNNLPNIVNLWNEIAVDLVRPEMKFMILVAMLVVLVHGMLVLLIMFVFHQINKHNINSYQKQVDVLVYFSVILLIFVSHLVDIFIWTYAMVNLEIFPSSLKTFYFAGEMYTNLDHNDPRFKLGPDWNMLPILLSFSGLFAVAISGSALYTLLVSTFTKPSKDQ